MLERDRKLKLPDGLVVWARLSDTQGALLYVYGTTEFYGTSLIRALLESGDTVVDVGANLGEYALLSAKRVGPTGRVLAFEPHPVNYQLLSRSVLANRSDNVKLFRLALADALGIAYLENLETANSGLARVVTQIGGEPVVEVQCEALDAIVEREPISQVDLVKVDVEGLEPAVLRGAERLLTRDKPLVFFEVNALRQSDCGFTAPSIEILLDMGYDLYGVEPLRDGGWRLARLGEGESPLRFRDRWQHDGYQPNLLAAHTHNIRKHEIIQRLLTNA
jgi:FkbM family methyltransferase